MTEFYVLKDRVAELATIMEWAKMFEDQKARIVAQEQIGDAFVSTIFLGLNHRWGDGCQMQVCFMSVIDYFLRWFASN